MIITLLKERRQLNDKINEYYKQLLNNTTFRYSLSDSSLIDYLERVESLPLNEARYKILTSVEYFFKDNKRVSKQVEIEIEGIRYLIVDDVVKEITNPNIPLYHKIGYSKGFSRKKTFIITPHAIIRYLERVSFVSIAQCRCNILKDIQQFFKNLSKDKLLDIKGLSSWQIKKPNYTISLKQNVVITIY